MSDDSTLSEDVKESLNPTLSTDIEESLNQKSQSVVEWILLDGNRHVVAFAVLVLAFAALALIELAGDIAAGQNGPLYYLLSSLLGGNITLITVVVSINQLLLGREFKAPGELEAEIQNVIDYRNGVEQTADSIAPVEPLGFLRILFENTEMEARELRTNAERYDSDAFDEVDTLASSLIDHVDTVTSLLSNENDGTFDVLSTTLTTNYARQINFARRIRHTYGTDLSGPTRQTLDNLIDHLQRIDIARQYFKSVYLQQELSSLSRRLFYAGIPAEIVTAAALLSLSEPMGATVLTRHVPAMMLVVVTIGFLPLALLFAYILRIATVTQRTTAIIPFTTPEQEQ